MTAAGVPNPPRARKGSVLILSLVIAAVLALLATAFIVTARVERQAAVNTLCGTQAEAACRAGLAAAIYRIELTAGLYSNLDDPAKWHYYWEQDSPAGVSREDLCPSTWVDHYGANRMRGRRVAMPIVPPTEVSTDEAKALKRKRGFESEYYVAVADLDGKLHCNPKFYDNLLSDVAPDQQTQDMLDELSLSSLAARDALLNDASANWSLGQLRTKLIAAGVGEAEYRLNETERFMSVYPRVSDLSAGKGAIPRASSRVNVNTARAEVLRAIVRDVPGLDPSLSADVASRLVAQRPFANREDMEKALLDLGQTAWPNRPAGYPAPTKDKLSEKQMNDLLNSLAGESGADDSALDDAATPGYYHYDFDDSGTGEHSSPDDDAGATWGAEVKFTSRFFHIYTLGRTVSYSETPPRVTAERRLHAIYDSETRKVLWLRWHFYARANMMDTP